MDQSPFNFQTPVKPPIFVSRTNELDFLRKNICYNNESVILSGPFHIGKSSTIFTFLNEIDGVDTTGGNKIFPVRINPGQLYSSLRDDFLCIIIHEMVANIWTKILSKDYSMLLEEGLSNTSEDHLHKHEVRLKRIYKIVSSSTLSSNGKSFTEFSSQGVGKIGQATENSFTRKPLQTFEFMFLLDELMEILSDFGYHKMLFVCDELNHLPPKVNYDLISTHFDLFSSKKVLFVITASEIKNDKGWKEHVDMEVLINSIGKKKILGPFETPEEIGMLIKNSLLQSDIKSISFDTNIHSDIFDITEGYPYFIARLCDTLFFDAYTNKIDTINQSMLNKYIKDFTNRLNNHKSSGGLSIH